MSEVKPYPGLRSFTEDDAPYFFGRDRERKIISANLRTRRLTLLYGRSGVGKSSVINAGVISHLRQRTSLGGRLPSGARIKTAAFRKPAIPIVVTKWQANPLESLNRAILNGAADVIPWDEKDRIGALTLPKMIEEITTFAPGVELLVILDQFEEYFVYHSEDEIAKQFDDEFSRTLINEDLRANFLISIREDWLARLDRLKGRIPNLFENTLRIEHLERSAADEAIRRPIETYNQRIPEPGSPQVPVEITDDFVNEALEQLEGIEEDDLDFENPRSSGTKSKERRIRTSRLQIVLEDLWDRVKRNSPPRLGVELLPRSDTAKTIIESHLNKSLAHLSRKESAVAASFFPFLTTTGNTKFADSAKGLADRSAYSAEVIGPVLKRLSDRDLHILNEVAPAPDQINQVRYELTSDALAVHILSWSKKTKKRQRRKKVIRNYIVLILALIAIGTVSWLFLRARQQRQAAIVQKQMVEIERAKAQRALDAVRRLDMEVPYSKAVLRSHGQKVTSAVFTPDGHVLTASGDGSAILWDINSMDPIHEFNKNSKKENPLICAAVSPKGGMMVTASADGTLTLWSLGSGDIIKQLHKRHHVTSISFSRNGDFIAAANTVGDVIVWNTETGEPVKEVPGHNNPIAQIAFSPKDTFLAAASWDHTVRIWRTADWSETTPLMGHTDKVNGLAFSPDEKSIATAGADATVRVWEVPSGVATRVLFGHAKSVNSVEFDKKDANRLLSASDDNTARIWNIERSKSIELIGHTDKVLSAAFSPYGQQVVTASKDHVVRIWSASTGTNLVELNGHLDEVTYVAYSSDGKYILTASDDATARVWYGAESGNFAFAVDQPTIEATPNKPSGPCPVTISFVVGVHVTSGSGTVVFELRRNGSRDGPPRELPFDEPETKYVKWYRSITTNYRGSETIKVLEPKGVKAQRVWITVDCNKNQNASPTPTPSPPIPK